MDISEQIMNVQKVWLLEWDSNHQPQDYISAVLQGKLVLVSSCHLEFIACHIGLFLAVLPRLSMVYMLTRQFVRFLKKILLLLYIIKITIEAFLHSELHLPTVPFYPGLSRFLCA